MNEAKRSADVREALKTVYDWMRQPDWAEEFGSEQIVAWVNARPLKALHVIQSALEEPARLMPDPRDARIESLEELNAKAQSRIAALEETVGAAHDYLRDALKLTEDKPYRFDFYAWLIKAHWAARDKLTAAEARIKVLEDALRPFAGAAEQIVETDTLAKKAEACRMGVGIFHFRSANKALWPKPLTEQIMPAPGEMPE